MFSDALGQLVALTDTELTIDTRRGLIVVPVNSVTHAKRVPARRRPTAAEVAALERAAAQAWPAPDTERLGAWLLRAAEGWTSRANSALAVGDPGRPLPEAIDATAGWYASRGLPARITTPLPLATTVAGALRARGWTARPTVLVQTAALAAIPTTASERSSAASDAVGITASERSSAASDAVGITASERPVALSAAPSEGWLAIVAGRKGSLPAVARTILSAPVDLRFAEVYEDARLIAIARGAITGGWLGISLVEVLPEARRRGLARAVVAALARWGQDAGAARCYLQVEERNTAAVALYAELGFTTHHRYVTWTG